MRMGVGPVGQAVFLRPKKFDGKGGICLCRKGPVWSIIFLYAGFEVTALCQASTNKRIYYLGFTMAKRDIA